MLCIDCILHITSFLTLKDTIIFYSTSKSFNFCLQQILKNIIFIQKRIKHYLKGKRIREHLSYKYCSKLYNFKPFIISRIFDSSPLFKYRNNNSQFLSEVVRHLTVLHNRSEEDPEDSTLLTESQEQVFKYVILYEKNINRALLKKLLNTLSVGQLSYVR